MKNQFKPLLLAASMLLAFSTSYAQTWALDKSHAKVGFTVTHMMLAEVDGQFKTFEAKITSSKPDFSDAVFEYSADVNSIDTGNERRDGDMKSEKWFDAAKFPTLTFKSKSFQKVADNKFKLTGDLTIHGVTKPVTLDGTMVGPKQMQGRDGKPGPEKVGFKLVGTIKRTDFGVGGSGAMPVSEEVELRATGEFTKQAM
ncbi:YceI family protein [Spirosoma sp. BT702]|uniref:YceI family protein n=1 Tax=Spirosoma profusum TaxID=2771354 RepID=A0A926XWK4_9BACT|nr:YceI family protein [Spirosoma profusum]MBD2699122.1 YceI family protein [Spirosoma profusum]